MQEAGLKMEDGGKEPFSELNRILDSLKQRDLGPALEWAQSHRESLDTQVNYSYYTAYHSECLYALFHIRFFMTLSASQTVQSVLFGTCVYNNHFRVPGYRSRGHRFNSRRSQIFGAAVGLKWGPLSLMSINE
jgi:hypothetical protein